MQHLPTILLAFADAKGDLPQLKQESSALKDAFLLLEHEGLIHLEREESITVAELGNRLTHYLSSLVVFHYAGHAHGTGLLFEGSEARADGLAGMLAQAPYLRLVFLNGCETAAQAQRLLDLGVPTVIATAQAVPDRLALEFATVFYEALSRKETIQVAFDFARHFLATQYDLATQIDRPSLSWADEADEVEEPPYWRIFGAERARQWRVDLDIKTWLNLGQGSKLYLQELLRGPLRHHRKLVEANDARTRPRAHVQVRADDGQKRSFPEAVAWLATQGEARHAWLTGEPGSGRTGSVVKLWYDLLYQAESGEMGPVPIFIDLTEWHEQYAWQPQEESLVDYIARYYLELEGLTEQREREEIRRLMAQAPADGRPQLLLLLDGSSDAPPLRKELRSLARQPNVQLLFTANEVDPEGREQAHVPQVMPPLGFQYLHILPLDAEALRAQLDWSQVKGYRREVRDLLSNLAWLNCFFTFYDKIDSGEPWEYITDFSTEAEMLWNSLEGQMQDHVIDPHQSPERLAFTRFYLRHFLPHLAYLMESDGLSQWEEDDMLATINQISAGFYQRRFLRAFPAYRRYMHHLRLKAKDWVEEEERLAIVVELGRDFGIFTETRQAQWVNSFARDYRHLLQQTTYTIGNRTLLYFLSALHIRNDIQAALGQGEWPETMRERPLPEPVRRMLGQLEGVSRQKTQSALLRLLERCRGVFDAKVIGYTVWNILSIWQDLNGYFIGLSLARLDLRGVALNYLARELSYAPYYLSTDLTGALLDWPDVLKPQPAYALAGSYTPDGRSFLTGETDGTLRQWDTELGICYQILDAHQAPIYAVCQVPGSPLWLTGSADGTIKVWDQQSELCLLQVALNATHQQAVFALACQPVPDSPGEWYLVSGSRYTGDNGDNLRLWQLSLGPGEKSARLLKRLPGHGDDVRALDLRVEGAQHLRLISGSWDNAVRHWRLDLARDHVEIYDQHAHVSRVHRVAFSPDGAYAASASSDDTIILWDLATPGQGRIRRLRGHIRSVNAIRFLQHPQDGSLWLLSGGSDQRVLVWHLRDLWTQDDDEIDLLDLPVEVAYGAWEREAMEEYAAITEVDFSPDGQHLAFATDTGQVHLMAWRGGGEFGAEWMLETNYELHVQGCLFVDLHEQSQDPQYEQYETLLRQYGAIFNQTDQANWNRIVARLQEGSDKWQAW